MGAAFAHAMTDSHNGHHHGVNIGVVLDVLHKKAAGLWVSRL
tara:strand:- start:977 stop:1102 length:126 start_codon:yes stop_codon:yes gene_type:complete